MKNSLRCLLLMLTITFGLQHRALASHSMGADISYTNVGQDSFLITLNFYRDCAGTTAPTIATIEYHSVLCNFSSSIDIALSPTIMPQNIPNGSEVSALCGNSIGNSTCSPSGGNLPGVQQYQYTGLVVLPSRCTDWVFSYDLCCRNSLITNLQNPGSTDIYVEAVLNNTIVPQDNSTTFTNRPVPYFCYLDSIQYNQGSIDIDGDSLVYTLINPLGGPGLPATYNSPYTPQHPINGSFQFDSITGQMSFVPAAPQSAVIAVLVTAYRNGIFIGSVMRDIQVNILGNPTCVPPYGKVHGGSIDSATVAGGVLIQNSNTSGGAYTLQVCPGANLNFHVDFGGDSVYLASNAPQALPGATFTTTVLHTTGSIVDSIRGNFSWTPTALDTGIKVFSINYGIRACPIDRTASRTVTIEVLKGTSAGADKTYCTAGLPVQLSAVGGTSFTWSPAAGLSSTTIRNPTASPTVTTDYVVTSNLQGQCHNSDTVRVKVVPNFIESISPQNGNINLCRNALVGLSVTADPIYGPFTYAWTPGIGLIDSAGVNDSTTSSVFARPLTNTTYYVYVTSDTGCTIRDSVNINLTNQGPKVVIQADKHQVCSGDTVHLDATVFPVSCGAANGTGSCTSSNPPVQITYGTGTTVGNITPFGGNNPTYRYQALYRQSDLVASGIHSGTIVRLRFNAIRSSFGVYNHFTIRMGCTSSTQLTKTNWENASTQVYYSASQLINNGANTFNLNQPYDWDGYSNIVIEICFGDTTGAAGGDDDVISTTVLYDASMAASSSASGAGCSLPVSAIGSNQPSKSLPNITFFFCAASNPAYTYSWAPVGGLSNSNTASTVATVTQPVTYILTVADSACTGNDLVRLFPDSTTLILPNDTALCSLAPTDSLHFHAIVGGTQTGQCGLNGNTCIGPLVDTKVGNGTVAGDYFEYPSAFGNYYGSAMQQFLYLASDLRAAGVQPGRVKELAFYVTNLNFTDPGNFPNYTISEKCTNISQLTAASPETGLSVVFTPKSVTPVVGTNNFVLDNAFDWDGVSNVVLQVCFDNTAAFIPYSENASTASTSTGYLSSTSYLDDDFGQCSSSSQPTITGAQFYLPNTRFSVCQSQAPSTITWSPSTGISDIHSLNPSVHPTGTTTYKATVVTSLGCTKVDSVKVTIGSLVHTISANDTVCTGGTGTQLQVTGGNKYAWTPALGLSCTTCANPIANPTVNTRYHVTITDTIIGCSVTDSVLISVASGPAQPFGADTSICFTDSVVLHAGPGFTTYHWSVPNGNDSNLVVRTAGTYSVTITAASGCSVSDTITINTRSRPVVDLGPDQITCAGNTITLDAGNGFSTYAWAPTAAATETLAVTTTNEYMVTVTDLNGCSSSDSVHVAFNPVPVVNLGNDTTLCNADTLRLSAYNGPYFDYLWSTGETGGAIQVTAATVQPVYVTVSGGGAICTATDTINVTFRSPVAVNIGNDTAICFGQSVTFDAGAGFVSYAWNTTPPASTQTVTVTTAGTYTVTVTDNLGCRGMDSAVVTINTTPVTILTIPPNVTHACVGDSIVLVADAGLPTSIGNPYLWSTGANTDRITVTATGNYCVTVTPLVGCPGFACDSITFVAPPTVDLGPDTLVCAGTAYVLDAGAQNINNVEFWEDNSNGRFHTVTTGGTYYVDVVNQTGCHAYDTVVVSFRPAAVVSAGNDTTVCAGQRVTFTATPGFASYSWSNALTTQSITVLTPGIYKVSAVDANGCNAVDSVILANINAAINIGPDSTKICNNSSLTLDAGAGYTTYSWTTPTGAASTETVTATAAGTYSITATDPSGCSATDAIVIGLNPAARPNLGNDTTLCPGTPFTLYPGAFYTYNWPDGTHNSTLTINAAGTYPVDVIDSNGCHGFDTTTVAYYPAPSPITPDNDTLCHNDTLTLHGPVGYSTYLWSSGSTDSTLTVTAPGSYSLTVTDSHGCPSTVVDTVTNGAFSVVAGVDPTPINIGQTATLSPQLTTAGNYTFVWAPGSSLNDSTLRNPIATPTVTTTYLVTVTNSDSHCQDTSSIMLTVFNQSLFVFPEAFTPNGDGENDDFGIISNGNVRLTSFNIYNRFGTRVHSAPIPWNGEVGGAPQPTDTYVFTATIEITDSTGTHTYNYSGAFTLIR